MLVSINCVTYNHESYIEKTIEGFLMQKTNFEFEIIIGEDCSTDRTREIIHSYMERYPKRINLITSESNVGSGQNSMRVFAASSGKYIALCEGDDYWVDENKLQKQIDLMESMPSCSMCIHAATVIDETGVPTGDNIQPYLENRISSIEDIIFKGGGFCHTGSIVFKRSLLEEIPSFLSQAHVGDYALQLWCASKGEVHYINEVMSAYRTGAKDSWTIEMFSRTESRIRLAQNDILLLEGFNLETDKQYASIINKTIRKREFDILMMQNNIAGMKADKYRDIIAELSFLKRGRIYTKVLFPRLYLSLAKVKGQLKEKKANFVNRGEFK